MACWEALGTSAVLVVSDPAALAPARRIVEREIAAIDRACSRFRPDSDLSRVNARAGQAVEVDGLLLDALDVALRAAELTGGAVDPTLGVALQLSGYDRDFKLLAPAQAGQPPLRATPTLRLHARTRPGWQAIERNRATRTVRIPRGVKLDLGATAKAWAADRASAAAGRATGSGVLVSLGGDISTHGPAPHGGWAVHVTDDHRAGLQAPGQRIAIQDGGLATSSTAARRWSHRGRSAHHLLDPASGAPVDGPWRTVSVAAADCTDANIASTAAIVLGQRAADWLGRLKVPARLVGNDGEVLTLGGWPADPRQELLCA